ncbi:putative SnoaL-like domain-containing protein [Seiridium cardinale]
MRTHQPGPPIATTSYHGASSAIFCKQLIQKSAISIEPKHLFEAQLYGLPSVFGPINIQRHTVTWSGNPIDSKVKIYVGSDGKIEKVEDRWNDNLPGGGDISQGFRKLNTVTVRAMVKVPKNEEEDKRMQQESEDSSYMPRKRTQ